MEGARLAVCAVLVFGIAALGVVLVALREVRLARESSLNEMRKFAAWATQSTNNAWQLLVEERRRESAPTPVPDTTPRIVPPRNPVPTRS